MPRLALAPFSDLHLESSAIVLDTSKADVVIFAGDIYALGQATVDSPGTVIDIMANLVQDKPIIFVPGNHDFDNAIISEQIQVWKKIAQNRYKNRIHVLFGDTVDLFGVRFLGATLFSNFASTGAQEKVLKEAQQRMPDFRKIFVDEKTPATAQNYCQWHEETKVWLDQELQRDLHIPKIVVSHFAPSPKISPRSRTGELIDAYWVNDCEDLVQKAHLWISGHTHCAAQAKLGRKKTLGHMVSNARGNCRFYNLSHDHNFKSNLIVPFYWK